RPRRITRENRVEPNIRWSTHSMARDFRTIAAPPNNSIATIGMSERGSPGPKKGSPRLKDAHSDGGVPGAWCENTIASSNVMRLTEVWPVNVAALHGGVIGTSGENWPWISSGKMYCVSGRG